MFAVHGFWSGDGLSLWAEDSDLPTSTSSQAVRSVRPHPFAATADALTGLLPGTPTTAELQLPSQRSAPLDSPELLRVNPRRATRVDPVLSSWRVPAVRLEGAAGLAWLTDPGQVAARFGASVTHLRDLARFARDLAERGRVLPAVTPTGTGGVAHWRPVLQGPDALAQHRLVAALPPVSRAAGGQGDARAIVDEALHRLTDAAVRERLAEAGSLLPARRGRRPTVEPVADAWLGALTGPDGRFAAPPDGVARLAQALSPWAQLGSGEDEPARATFRLVEPPADATPAVDTPQPWRLEFLLQSTTDPSLLIPAPQAWDGGGPLRRWVDRPQELLLTELGRASRLYPALATGLRSARPDHLDLDHADALEFLTVAAPALDEAGFGMLMPNWWRRRRPLGLRMTSSTPTDAAATEGRFGRDQVADFEWRLALGDESLTDAEIEAIAATKAPLVRLRGQWVAVDPEQLRRGLDFLEREGTGRTTAAQVLALAATHPEDVDLPLRVSGIEADGWLGALLAGTTAEQLEPVAPTERLRANLRPYQERGLSWLTFLSRVGLGACLADDMGLGKTLQLLALEATERDGTDEAAEHLPSLLLCPMSLIGNWQAEVRKFAPHLRLHVHHGPQRLSGPDLTDRLAETDIVVTTYSTATRDIDDLEPVSWNRVVLDEAQAIKNRHSRAAKAVGRLQARHRVALTGTPVENRLGELWSIMNFLNPGLLGSPETFRARYAIPVERHADTDAAVRLRQVTRPYLLRRVKTDPAIIDDLPEKIEVKQYYRLTTEQASLYQSVVDDMMDRIAGSDGIERRGNVLAAMTKLKQVCNHPAQLLHERSAVGRRSGKVIRLEEIVEEILAEDDRALLFTQYAGFAELVVPHLAARFGTDVLYLHGGTPRAARERMVERFQSDQGPPMFVLSLKAGGTGLNLTAANHVIHLDRWWNPAVENQATDRAFRIGQKRNVQVRKFIGTGTLEEKIDTLLEEKAALADMVVSDGEGWLTELSTGDLRELFTLSEGAVGE
ncbi:DEAD/DEAH box helicase [Occultella glacieicola]|uniref:DEAD/DEAH box helicase n=1 Tax=Occultella glacieicola TaxID=2518684 RepID=A0ABY2DYB9_9MICO|nr:DEAD/DEAH box helicase [Occultella glacieicola]TDE89477.1 DEAD/DEAH box helicase [Occultella glacieicola]